MNNGERIPVYTDAETAPEALGFDSYILAHLKNVLTKYVARGQISGAAVLIARRGRIAQLLSAGWADVEAERPLAPDALFRVFSLTKPVTSMAALMLSDLGVISLDDPVSDYIPAFREARVFVAEENGRIITEPPRRPVTIWHLLTHTSGIAGTAMRPDEPLAATYRRARIGDERLTLAETVERLAQIPLLFHPGEAWRYGVSTDVLARVVEVASGMRFGHFLRERLFAPLGMHDTFFAVPSDKRGRLATLYTAMTVGGSTNRSAPGGSASDGATRSALRPLRHADTTTLNAPPRASGQDAAPSAPDPSRNASDGLTVANGPALESGSSGLVSTVADYFRFAQMLLNGGAWEGRQLLKPQTVAQMTRNQLPERLLPYQMPWPHVARYTAGCGFGLGVRVVLDASRTDAPASVGEYGWAGAANTYLWVDPAEEIIALLFAQTFPFMHTDLDRRFRRLVHEAIVR